MAIIRRFSTIRQGGIVFTGNTAGLSPVNAAWGRAQVPSSSLRPTGVAGSRIFRRRRVVIVRLTRILTKHGDNSTKPVFKIRVLCCLALCAPVGNRGGCYERAEA